MLHQDHNQITVQHDNGIWTARHQTDEGGPGPLKLQVNKDVLARNVSFYIDEMEPESALINKCRAYHQGGAAVVETQGHFPFGAPLKFKQICRYAQNHLRVAFDLRWPRGFELQRHLGIGCLNLPGQWARMYIYPPARHLCEGALPGWEALPKPPGGSDSIMVGHWHRPPLALVFERADGTRLEIGTGDDLWRWETGLGYGPESGSFKVFLESHQVRLVREPLMCCIPFTPRAQLYRFKWYAAWHAPESARVGGTPSRLVTLRFTKQGKLALDKGLGAPPAYCLDFNKLVWPPSARRAESQADYLRGVYARTPCWQSNAARNLARRVIRQIKERLKPGTLCIKGLYPAPCWDPAHLDRHAKHGLPHWDLSDYLEFSVWTRRQLGPAWEIITDDAIPADLPSLSALFQPNGFANDALIDQADTT